MFLNNKVIVSRNCDILEEDVKFCGFEDEEENKIEANEKENQDKIPLEKRDDNDDTDETDVTESEFERTKRRTRRQVKPPLPFDEEYGYYCIYCNYCGALAPSDFQEATTCGEATKWKEAMYCEMDSLVKNQTWTLVNKPPKDKKVLYAKWVY